MPTLYLIRHGEAAASWGEAEDPGLSPRGRSQAGRVADEFARLPPAPILTSPLARCRETAAPLEAAWDRRAMIEPAVSEIPSPGLSMEERSAWLAEIFNGVWAGTNADLAKWREELLKTLLTRNEDTVIFTHFVAINAAVGAATGDARVLCFKPDYCSMTELSTDGARLSLIERGGEATTQVG